MMARKESVCASGTEAAMEMATTFSPNWIVNVSVLLKVMDLELLYLAISDCSLKILKPGKVL